MSIESRIWWQSQSCATRKKGVKFGNRRRKLLCVKEGHSSAPRSSRNCGTGKRIKKSFKWIAGEEKVLTKICVQKKIKKRKSERVENGDQNGRLSGRMATWLQSRLTDLHLLNGELFELTDTVERRVWMRGRLCQWARRHFWWWRGKRRRCWGVIGVDFIGR